MQACVIFRFKQDFFSKGKSEYSSLTENATAIHIHTQIVSLEGHRLGVREDLKDKIPSTMNDAFDLCFERKTNHF